MLKALILVGLDRYFWLYFPRNAIKLVIACILRECLLCISFYLRVCRHIWQFFIGNLQFLNSLLYWYTGTIQSLSSLDQVKQFILECGSDPEQVTNVSSSSLHNLPHRGPSIFSPDPPTLYNHFTATMVDVTTSGAWLLIISPSGSESSICIDSCF